MSTDAVAQQLVVFSLGDEEYALPITRVQEIIRYSEPRAVSSELPWIRGRHLACAARSCRSATSRPGSASTSERPQSAKIVIVDTESGTAGVIVDDVEEVMTVDPSQLDTVPAAGADFIEAVAKIDDRLVVLLNPDGLLAGLALAA